ncbi:hypothetical protein [Pseudomonas viridiflava]|uniref:hypothetical protein n=1 Tax=Pseudomonas viridiflava TaxID=33069 RepID=UPI001C3155C3|nr:hypothetical protein [Pseudomonas viridiflava]MEE3926395.1 hypothetical protein [Pseudomonas viridiflava]MEE3932788.1 hypothetical protein [Pseudomonas viridiflava]MEE3939696.1 hypothetical protein [Pseudomonas viridiflava]MEE3969367.1 hypothetical protein [Pseudomonas viridiflava]MEE3983766.1 hypothetical protein [Pseudomonas viridiflava]
MIAIFSLVLTCFAIYLNYLNSSPEAKDQARKLLTLLLGSAGRVIMGLAIMSVTILSALCIILFWIGEGPITRPEVVMLILHFVNLTMYGAMCIAMIIKACAKPPRAAGAVS